MASKAGYDAGIVGGNCRFYEKEFPDLDECVLVNVRSIAEMGAYVQLLEYDGIEGMVLLSELSRRRIRSINKLIRVGKNEVVMVIRVDKEKRYIDLSKRRVTSEEAVKAEDRYSKAKAVHSILRHVAGKCKVSLLSLYQRLGWPLYKKYGHAFDAFNMAVENPEAVWSAVPEATPEELRETLEHIKKKMTPQPLKIRADIQVTCFGYEGIEAVRRALMAGQVAAAAIPDAPEIRTQLIAPPLYVMLTQSLDTAAGINALNVAIEAVKGAIEKEGGQLVVRMAPQVTSAQDESALSRYMEELELAAAEESGSEGEGDDEGMGGADFDFEGGAAAGGAAAGGAGDAAAAGGAGKKGSK